MRLQTSFFYVINPIALYMLSDLKVYIMTKEEKIIERLKREILDLGPMLPGSISEQYNVCGKAGCKCKNAKNPVKHGPYYQLSFTLAGKSSSFFIKQKDLSEVRRRIKRFKVFKQLIVELTQAYIALVRKKGFERS